MSKLVAFDPGVKVAGFSLFQDGKLESCGLLRGEDYRAMSKALTELRVTAGFCEQAVIEWPQVYEQRKWEGDPNDMIDVAATAGAFRYLFADAEVRTVRPRGWKGTAPKRVMLDRIVSRVGLEELEVLHAKKLPAALKHNMIDAVGIGLWALGRL